MPTSHEDAARRTLYDVSRHVSWQAAVNELASAVMTLATALDAAEARIRTVEHDDPRSHDTE
ncbi:hypothetical protein [Conexibacter woesei]|uniref:hypothetical protein n=1 Tax=Conexibacter woesei TaxID=191495 RepID=UPI0012DDF155|nr:hypothetical protein [Conexibacter woesei]